jgi:hypothetical protein
MEDYAAREKQSPGQHGIEGCTHVTDSSPAPTGQQQAPKLDTTVPHSARIWNYWLGGKDNFTVDRQMGDQIGSFYPGIFTLARSDRAFLGRAVRYLAGEAGIRQFLDIGTGLPTADNTHEVAQQVAPESRVVYVDNDPLVLAHARALLVSTPEGACHYIDADLHDPKAILDSAEGTLDFSQPVALMLIGVLQFVQDDDEAYGIVRRLLDAVTPGSYLAIVHPTHEIDTEAYVPTVEHWNAHGTPKLMLRSREQIARFFDGLELLEPGVVSLTRWRPDDTSSGEPDEVPGYCGVARKA